MAERCLLKCLGQARETRRVALLCGVGKGKRYVRVIFSVLLPSHKENASKGLL